MDTTTRLTILKLIHTAIWILYNIVIFYMLFAAITGRLDKWLWIGYVFVGLEGVVLLLFGFSCPLTILARRYSDSVKANFDIYLPEWLARYTKIIYTGIVIVISLIVLIRLVVL